MDSMTYEHLLYALRGMPPRMRTTADVPVTSLTIGTVLADSPTQALGDHVVVARPEQVTDKTVAVWVRSIYGGHTIALSRRPASKVRVVSEPGMYLSAHQTTLVPQIPVPVLPRRLDPLDRVYYQYARVDALPTTTWYHSGTGHWHGGRGMPGGSLRRLVRNPASAARGWYVHVPVGHVPHLYADGLPVVGRRFDQLRPGDVLRYVGGCRAAVVETRETSMVLEVVQPTVERHLMDTMWLDVAGARAEHHNTGNAVALYPCEPRAEELVGVYRVAPGDTVITHPGRRDSRVVTVESVSWRHSQVWDLGGVTVDGAPVGMQADEGDRFVILHSSRLDHTWAATAPEPAAAHPAV